MEISPFLLAPSGGGPVEVAGKFGSGSNPKCLGGRVEPTVGTGVVTALKRAGQAGLRGARRPGF